MIRRKVEWRQRVSRPLCDESSMEGRNVGDERPKRVWWRRRADQQAEGLTSRVTNGQGAACRIGEEWVWKSPVVTIFEHLKTKTTKA